MVRFMPFLHALLFTTCLHIPGCGQDVGNERSDSSSNAAPALRHYGQLGGDFELVDQQGKSFRLEQLQGRAVLLFFGYTHCPDFCPLILSKLAKALELLGAEREKIRVVFISLDPERDTPQKLKEYLEYFSIDVVGLTGDIAQIADVARRYGVAFSRRDTGSGAGYLIDHSTYTFLVDQQGHIRYIFRYGDPPELIAEMMAQLFARAKGRRDAEKVMLTSDY